MTSRKKSKPGPFVTALRRMRGGASSHFSGNADACATRGRLAGLLRGEGGQALILVALSLTGIMGAMALAIDVGNLHYRQEQLQNAAEAAALAGALEVGSCGGTSSSSGGPTSCTEMKTAGTSSVNENLGSTPSLASGCNPSPSGTAVVLALNWGPCALGSTDPNNASGSYVEAVITQNVPSFFGGVLGHGTVQITARSEAHATVVSQTSNGPCLNTNDLTLNSGTDVSNGPGATCTMNDNASNGLSTNSGVSVNVTAFDYHGSTYNDNCGSCSTYKPMPTTNTPTVADPFATLISNGTLTVPSAPAAPTGNTATTLNPGLYSSGYTFSNDTTYTLNPGVYYFESNMILDTGAVLNGTGVTIYLTGSAGINSNGSGSQFNLSAPSSGPQAGMLIWGSASDSSAVNLDAGSSSSFKGAIYLPDSQLTLNGDSTVTSYGMIYANAVMLNSSITLTCSYMPGGTCPGGTGSGSGTTTASLAE